MNYCGVKSLINKWIFVLALVTLLPADFAICAHPPKSIYIDEIIDLTIPFKSCYQYLNKKLTSIAGASDNQAEIYLVFQRGSISKLNIKNNKTLWLSDLGGEIVSDLEISGQAIYLITKLSPVAESPVSSRNEKSERYILWSLDAETGITRWQLPLSLRSFSNLQSFQNKLYITEKNGTVYSVSENDQKKILLRDFSLNLSASPAFFDDKIFLGSENNSILAFSQEAQSPVATIQKLRSPATNIIAAKEKLFFGERKGSVNLFDIKNGNLVWSVRYGGEISNLALVEGGVLATSFDNFVYLVSSRRGKQIWKRRLAGRVVIQPLIINNYAIFVVSADNSVVILELKTGKIVNRLSFAEKGYILSKPLSVGNLLIFLTSSGVYSFTVTSAACL